MQDIKTVGIDLAKNVFYIHGVNERGKTVLKKKLKRAQILPFFANLKPCLIGMESGAGAHYWAREFIKQGHDARIMAAQFVKPYVKNDKTDANDAEAICEAVLRPNMRFVGVKAIAQQDIQSVHRIRQRLVGARRALACEIRGLLGEYGLVIPTGIRKIPKELPGILADDDNQLTSFTRILLQDLLTELSFLTEKINKYNKYISLICKNDEIAQKLTTIPGVGELAATAIIASVSDPKLFKNGREFAAYLGLVPKQRSSGGKMTYLGISKRGDKYIRTLLIHGARVLVAYADKPDIRRVDRSDWINKVKDRRGYCKAAVALANKTARIAWAVMDKNEVYKPTAA